MKEPQHLCPVCGFRGLSEAPRTRSGGGSYEICPCCGFQFGVDDDDRGVSHVTHRSLWQKGGFKWGSKNRQPPEDWDPRMQLETMLTADGRQVRPKSD